MKKIGNYHVGVEVEIGFWLIILISRSIRHYFFPFISHTSSNVK